MVEQSDALLVKAQALVADLRRGQEEWASLPVEERARRLQEAGRVLLNASSELTRVVSEETGRMEVETYGLETVGVADLFGYWCSRGPALLAPRAGHVPALDMPGKKARVERRPRGVVGGDLAVELPGEPADADDGAGAAGGERGGAEAVGVYAADGALAGGAAAGVAGAGGGRAGGATGRRGAR
jgi:acyl-CoA reductase-like NAD-dependent aldehyde dehydrogenase